MNIVRLLAYLNRLDASEIQIVDREMYDFDTPHILVLKTPACVVTLLSDLVDGAKRSLVAIVDHEHERSVLSDVEPWRDALNNICERAADVEDDDHHYSLYYN